MKSQLLKCKKGTTYACYKIRLVAAVSAKDCGATPRRFGNDSSGSASHRTPTLPIDLMLPRVHSEDVKLLAGGVIRAAIKRRIMSVMMGEFTFAFSQPAVQVVCHPRGPTYIPVTRANIECRFFDTTRL